jgi:hypothetical protein
MAFATITVKPKPTATPAKIATTTNMTSPHERGRKKRDHAPSIPALSVGSDSAMMALHRSSQAGALQDSQPPTPVGKAAAGDVMTVRLSGTDSE